MKHLFLIAGISYWIVFAYSIENNKDFMTWIYLMTSILFLAEYYVRRVNLKK